MEDLTLTLLNWFCFLLVIVMLVMLVSGCVYAVFEGVRWTLRQFDERVPRRPIDRLDSLQAELESWRQDDPQNPIARQLLEVVRQYQLERGARKKPEDARAS